MRYITKLRTPLLLAVVLLLVSTIPAVAQGPDPSGSGADAATAVNFTWTLVAAFLVFFMQAGFAFLEAEKSSRRGWLERRIRSIS